jgi:hypothetical protein
MSNITKNPGNYTEDLTEDELDKAMGIQEFKDCVENKVFRSYEGGYAFAVQDGLQDSSVKIYADELKNIPFDATHIIWYSK